MADRYGFAAKLTLLPQSRLISEAMVERLRVEDGFCVIMLGMLGYGFCLLITACGQFGFRRLVAMGSDKDMG